VVARPAQAQLAGPAQVKIYKTSVQKCLTNLHKQTANPAQKFKHVVQFITSTFGDSPSGSGTCPRSSPSSLLLLLLLLPEPSPPDSPELSPEDDFSGDAAARSSSSFSLSCETKRRVKRY
jgi:hypothetical protein